MAHKGLYEIQGDKLVRKRRTCPKCGEGTFLGQHKNRESCGQCGYTEFTKKDEPKPKADKPAEKPEELLTSKKTETELPTSRETKAD